MSVSTDGDIPAGVGGRGGCGYSTATPTDRELPTFMKHAQHPIDARHCQIWLAAAPEGDRLQRTFALLAHRQAPQISQEYSTNETIGSVPEFARDP